MNRIEVMELVRDYQVGGLNRRQFLKRATAAIGSLAAAQTLLTACAPNPEAPPVVDATQPPPEVGTAVADTLTRGIVTYPGTEENPELMGYLSYPTTGDGRKAVIVIQEWWGLNEHIKAVADRFAELGYVALAPDLYNGVVTTEPDEARKLAMELGMRDAVSEIAQGLAYLQSLPQVGGGVGIIGFCMGGGLVLQSLSANIGLSAGAAFYGSALAPEMAQQVEAPVLSFLGTADRIPASSYETMHAIFDTTGIPHRFTLYEGAQHAFFNDTRASYDAEAAEDAWQQTLAWFEEYL